MIKPFHVVELNKLGDHVVMKECETLAQATQFKKMLEKFAFDNEEYYVTDIRDEWVDIDNDGW